AAPTRGGSGLAHSADKSDEYCEVCNVPDLHRGTPDRLAPRHPQSPHIGRSAAARSPDVPVADAVMPRFVSFLPQCGTHGCDNQPPITGWLSQPCDGTFELRLAVRGISMLMVNDVSLAAGEGPAAET
ncbi:MAG TPA: hypothetical protein VKU39_06705, partial [Streptosporangiaceae bacterium]|nr:hypothetical protein [Streptosporangiaceae bacterium]